MTGVSHTPGGERTHTHAHTLDAWVRKRKCKCKMSSASNIGRKISVNLLFSLFRAIICIHAQNTTLPIPVLQYIPTVCLRLDTVVIDHRFNLKISRRRFRAHPRAALIDSASRWSRDAQQQVPFVFLVFTPCLAKPLMHINEYFPPLPANNLQLGIHICVAEPWKLTGMSCSVYYASLVPCRGLLKPRWRHDEAGSVPERGTLKTATKH